LTRLGPDAADGLADRFLGSSAAVTLPYAEQPTECGHVAQPAEQAEDAEHRGGQDAEQPPAVAAQLALEFGMLGLRQQRPGRLQQILGVGVGVDDHQCLQGWAAVDGDGAAARHRLANEMHGRSPRGSGTECLACLNN
jgi:hypothetical protein